MNQVLLEERADRRRNILMSGNPRSPHGSRGAPQPPAKGPKAKQVDKDAYEGSLDGISPGADPEDEDGAIPDTATTGEETPVSVTIQGESSPTGVVMSIASP